MNIAEKRRKAASKLSRPKPVELPSGAWRCQIMVNGERIGVVDEDPSVAHAKALALKEGLIEKEASVANMTVGAAIDKYIESKDTVLSPSTVRGYKNLRKHALQELMPVPLSSLTQEAVQKSINKMAKEKSPKYVKNAHGLLTAALSVYYPQLKLSTTLPQKTKYDISIPSNEDVALIAEQVKGKKFELPFLLAAWMGLRTSEIRGLTWDCVEGNTLHIKQAMVDGEDGPVLKSTKTYSGDRKLEMPERIRDLIKSQEKKDKYIIHYNRNQLYKCLERICKKNGLQQYRFHDLRHYYASVMLSLGVPDKYAMEQMGHASPNMLKNVYQHTMDQKRAEVVKSINSFFEPNLHTDLHTENEKCSNTNANR